MNNNSQDYPSKNENEEYKKNPKKDKPNFIQPFLVGITIMLSIIYIILEKYKLAIIFAILSLIIIFGPSIYGFLKNQKIDTNINILQLIVALISLVVSIYAFYSTNTRGDPLVTPTSEVKEPTQFITEPPSVPETPFPTITIETATILPSSTPENYPIKVCVFDLGSDENNQPIVKTNLDNLKRLGFNAEIVDISNKYSYENCNVLYLSDGWIKLTKSLSFDKNIQEIINLMIQVNGPGLLIGNTGKNYGQVDLKLIDATITFYSLSDEKIGNFISKIYVDETTDLYKTLLYGLSNNKDDKEKLPEPESIVYVDKTNSYITLVNTENESYNSLISSRINGARCLIMPGGEFSSNDPISDNLFERFVRWLARKPTK